MMRPAKWRTTRTAKRAENQAEHPYEHQIRTVELVVHPTHGIMGWLERTTYYIDEQGDEAPHGFIRHRYRFRLQEALATTRVPDSVRGLNGQIFERRLDARQAVDANLAYNRDTLAA